MSEKKNNSISEKEVKNPDDGGFIPSGGNGQIKPPTLFERLMKFINHHKIWMTIMLAVVILCAFVAVLINHNISTPTVDKKQLSVRIGDQILQSGVEYPVAAGTILEVYVSPYNEFEKLIIDWQDNQEGVQEYSTHQKKIQIPESAKLKERYVLKLNALFSDGFYLDNKKAKNTCADEYSFIVDQELVANKSVTISYNDETLVDGETYDVPAGAQFVINAYPSDQVESIVVHWKGAKEPNIYTSSVVNSRIPDDAKTTQTYIMILNVLYKDGLYLNNTENSEEGSQIYTFNINKELVQNKEVTLTYNGKILRAGETYVVSQEAQFLINAFPPESVEKVVVYENGSSNAKSYFTSTVFSQIPDGAKPMQIFTMNFNALYNDGLYLNNKDDKSESPLTFNFIIEEEPKEERTISLLLNGVVLSKGSEYSVSRGDIIYIIPANRTEVVSVSYRWADEKTITTIMENEVIQYKIPENAKSGEKYTFRVNALYNDGTYVDGNSIEDTKAYGYYLKIK